MLAWRADDGFNASYPAFRGGTAVGQWRPTPPALASMSAQGLAFTTPFVLVSREQFPARSPRSLNSSTYLEDFNTVRRSVARLDQPVPDEQTALAPFWEGNASVHWNQAANQIARANHLSMSRSNRLLALLNLAMADTAFTTWSAKRYYGAIDTEVTWRPVTAIPLADTDGNPDTAPDPDWTPLVATPAHPEYAAGHPSQNGAAATVLLSCFDDAQTFTLTTRLSGVDVPRTYSSISKARTDGNNARVWGGMHYPSTVAISDKLGEAVANYVNLNAMQPLRGPSNHMSTKVRSRPFGARVESGSNSRFGRSRAMVNRVPFVLALATACLVQAHVLTAQPLTGSLIGTVKDAQGGALPGAVVRLSSPALIGGTQTLSTNEKGQLRFPVLPSSVYVLDVEVNGFKAYHEEGIRIGIGATIDRSLVLNLKDVEELVVVGGSGSRLEARGSGFETRFGRDLRRDPDPALQHV